jgi:hypothetical protein
MVSSSQASLVDDSDATESAFTHGADIWVITMIPPAINMPAG